jgi:hypothetical protein
MNVRRPDIKNNKILYTKKPTEENNYCKSTLEHPRPDQKPLTAPLWETTVVEFSTPKARSNTSNSTPLGDDRARPLTSKSSPLGDDGDGVINNLQQPPSLGDDNCGVSNTQEQITNL